MKPAASVLEVNLERLFARAYAPVLASPTFRARLLRTLELGIAGPKPGRQAVRWRVAAAMVVGLGTALLAWRLLHGPDAVGSVENLLAAGRPVVREGPAGAWRPISDDEIRSGIELGRPTLELATPRDSTAQVRLGSAGRLEAQAESRLSIDSPAQGALVVALERGAIALERYAAGETWRVSTSEGSILLDRGAIEIACLELRGSREMRARLRSGAAAIDGDPRTELVPGREVLVQGGMLVVDRGLDPSVPQLPERSSAGTTGVSEPQGSGTAAPATASLRGSLVMPAEAKPPDLFTVVLLRRERLPEVSRPDPRIFRDTQGSFAIDGLRPGTWSVFVRADGFAVWQTRDLELRSGGGATELRAVLDTGLAIRGRVIDPDGRPVEGAIVLSEDDTPSQLLPLGLDAPPQGSAAATSDSEGAFEIAHLRRGRHLLRATRAGLGAGWSEPIDLSKGDPPESVAIRLARPGAVEGQVARDDGAPWSGAFVVASLLDTTFEHACMTYGHVAADAEGRFAIEDLPPGLYVVLNVSEGRDQGPTASPRVQQVHIEAGVRTRVDLPGGSQGTTLEGTLLASDARPLAGCDVTLVPKRRQGADWKSTRSREGGRFDFPSLSPGTYAVYVGESLGAEFALQCEIEVPAVPVFRSTVRAGLCALRGGVLDARSGAGLPGSVIVLEVQTDAGFVFAGKSVASGEGLYVLRFLPAGSYRITAYPTTGRFGLETVGGIEIGASDTETVRDFSLHPGAVLVVRVADSTGKPVVGASVRFLDANDLAVAFSPDDVTDASGTLRVQGVKPGRWTVRASRERFKPASTTLDLVAEEERAVEIILPSSD